MGTYIVRRLIVAVPTVLGITVVVFVFLTLLPGPASPFLRSETAAVGQPFGVDLGLPIAYLAWLVGAFQGNLGYAAVGGFGALTK